MLLWEKKRSSTIEKIGPVQKGIEVSCSIFMFYMIPHYENYVLKKDKPQAPPSISMSSESPCYIQAGRRSTRL